MRLDRRTFLAAGLGSLMAARPARAQELTPGQYPLDLWFHGAGGSGLNTQYTWPIADELGFILLAPDSRDERTWDLVLGVYGPDVEFLMEAFRKVLGKCTVD